jgi:hypothetical protein
LQDPILKKIHHKKGLVEWLKVMALSSNPSTGKKKKEEKTLKDNSQTSLIKTSFGQSSEALILS